MHLDIESIRERVRPEIESAGFFLVELIMVESSLRVVIHKKGGVAHKDCIEVARLIKAIFEADENDILESFSLEVSSPGLGRKLKSSAELTYFIDEQITVTFLSEDKTTQVVRGKNCGLENDKLRILCEDNAMQEIAERSIKKIKLAG